MNVALRPEHLNILSICTGGGGLDLGLELAIQGARTVCMVEREAFAISSLVSAMEQGLLHPAPVWSDARTFDGRAWRGAVDGLIGGIPCQPHSLAGKKRGQHDERDLWSDARRIIVQSGAWFVLIENVAGMLAAGDDEIAGAERVHRDLRKLGFEVEGGLFTAAEVGATHQRERVFILGVADPRRICFERRGRAGDILCQEGTGEVQGPERKRNGRASGYGREDISGVGQADAYSERLEGIGPDAGAQGRPDARRPAGLCDGTTLEHAESIGRREGWPEPELWSGRDAVAGTDGAVAERHGRGQPSLSLADGGRRNDPRRLHAGHDAHGRDPHLFPPGPGNIDGWRAALERAPELEPAFRRVADGLASRLDIARVDRLRMLGNGVVPLQAAYAIRTLVTRLAARGSAGAARLVRMMEGIEV